jgi:hypothetical protein
MVAVNKKVVLIAVVALITVVLAATIILFLTSAPRLSVSYVTSKSYGSFFQYEFDVRVNVPSSGNTPFGDKATPIAIDNALHPLVDKYDLMNGTYDGIIRPNFSNSYLTNGESKFDLYSTQTLSDTQIQSLTKDLFNAINTAMNGSP